MQWHVHARVSVIAKGRATTSSCAGPGQLALTIRNAETIEHGKAHPDPAGAERQ